MSEAFGSLFTIYDSRDQCLKGSKHTGLKTGQGI